MAHHEGLDNLLLTPLARIDKGLGLSCIEAQRFFAQDVLAGIQSLDGPFNVKVVGQWIVNGIDR